MYTHTHYTHIWPRSPASSAPQAQTQPTSPLTAVRSKRTPPSPRNCKNLASTVSLSPSPRHALCSLPLTLVAAASVVAPLRAGWYNDYIRELGLSTDSTAYLQAPPSLLPRSQRIGCATPPASLPAAPQHWPPSGVCRAHRRRAAIAQASGERHASGEEAPFALAPLPDFGRSGDALAILVGNSRAMWPAFLRWLKAQKDPDALSDPVDTFAAEAIRGAVGRFAAASAAAAGRKAAAAHDSFWACDMSPARLVDMNRAARVAGVCYFSDAMFLSVHPTFGAWVAFRAVVVLDLPARDTP